jgi:cytoskeletal protein RodZ
MLDKFADELREQREKSGLTLQQMATKTRIDLKFLEAIDQGNFSFLPDLYVKAFVKQYAKTIGLDENIALKKYEAAKEGLEFDPSPPKSEEVVKPVEVPKAEQPKVESPPPAAKPVQPLKSYVDNHNQGSGDDENKANSQLMIFGLGGVVLIILAALLYFFIFNKSDNIIVEENPIEDIIEQENQRYEEAEPSEQLIADDTGIPVSSDSLYLTFYAKDTSWIFVVLDNNSTEEFTLNPNSKFSVTAAREFKATIGNSGGVTMQLNNLPVDFNGRVGSVRYVKIDKTGLIYLNAPPKLEQ